MGKRNVLACSSTRSMDKSLQPCQSQVCSDLPKFRIPVTFCYCSLGPPEYVFPCMRACFSATSNYDTYYFTFRDALVGHPASCKSSIDEMR